MKVVISNKAYFKPDDDLWEYCSKQTTYHIETQTSKFPKLYKNSGVVAKDVKWIPVTRVELLDNKGIKYEIVDKRTLAPVEMPKPSFNLRPEDQLPIFDECDDTCIINGKPGFGKTILALALAYKFGQKTLVICTNTSIREMWQAEVRKWFGFEPGVIGSGKFNIEPPIVISNIQTVNKHGLALAKVFGTVIVDEVHHCVATTFTNFLEDSCARYKIGLSGTLKRKDGLNVMFKDYFGYKVFSPPVNNTIAPVIHRYTVPVELSGNQNVPWALRANDVYNHPEYREAVINMADLYCRMGHRVLFVSDRTELIQSVLQALELRGLKTYEIIGATDLDTRLQIQKEVSEGGPCILGAAQSIFSEGISLNELSCLVMGSLINNESLIEQLAGRVQRIVEGKLDPVVIDFVMKGGTGLRQAAGRMAVYRNNGWKTVTMTPEKAVNLAKIVFGKDS